MELSDEVQETFVLHNRSFQRYAINNNTYFVPIDEVRHALLMFGRVGRMGSSANMRSVQDETLRLRIQHGVLTMMFDNRFIFPPIDAPRRILDCGFGTGEVRCLLYHCSILAFASSGCFSYAKALAGLSPNHDLIRARHHSPPYRTEY